ncbi:MAG: peptide ABC transporter substrate-binding protein [Oscillospiraceae bacterium]|jgi:oligopeptide transport system substrate-binding protein|nr:peptide ABC transporter substrate-binding protein [Oscillospiraceae bacterium]
MKKSLIACACLLLSFALLLTSCKKDDSPSALNAKDALNVYLGPAPSTLDPAYAAPTADGSLTLHLFEGLYTMGEDGSPVPALAASETVDDSGLVFTFTLRDGLKWSNGEPLSAQDFVYAWNRAAAVPGSRGRSDLFAVIARDDEGVLQLSAPNEKTLIVTLKEYTPYFKQLLTLPPFCPVYEKMVQYDAEHWSLNADACVGNGAYKLSEVLEDSHISVVKNENYYAADNVKIKQINFVTMTENTAYEEFLGGGLLFADIVPNTKIAEASKREDYYNKASYGTYYLLFNPDTDPFKKAEVREALMLAIDRSYIAGEICKGTTRPAGALVPSGVMKTDTAGDYRSRHGEFFDPVNHEENLARAKSLLKKAGYSEDGKAFPIITYQYNSGAEHTLIAKAVQHMWAEIGVTLRLEEADWNAAMQNAKNGDFQILRTGWMSDWNEPGAILSTFQTGNPQNVTGFSSKNFDRFLGDAAAETAPEKRAESFYDAEAELMKQWIVCPIFYYSDIYMQSERLTGVKTTPLEYKSFVNAEIKTK